MKNKLFNQLKTDYANLGLADDLLMAYAEANAGLTTDDNLQTVSTSVGVALKATQAQMDKLRGEKASEKKKLEEEKAAIQLALDEAKKNQTPPIEPPKNELDEKIAAAIESATKPLVDKLASYESTEKQSAFAGRIQAKATELGIPKWRLDEGFNIDQDADDTVITNTLTAIKQNLVVAGLTGERSITSKLDPAKMTSEELDKML